MTAIDLGSKNSSRDIPYSDVCYNIDDNNFIPKRNRRLIPQNPLISGDQFTTRSILFKNLL
jgi:hypothetical protein